MFSPHDYTDRFWLSVPRRSQADLRYHAASALAAPEGTVLT
jgi:hypothetical protein